MINKEKLYVLSEEVLLEVVKAGIIVGQSAINWHYDTLAPASFNNIVQNIIIKKEKAKVL